MNLKDNRFLRLTHNCIPTTPPVLWTFLAYIASDIYEMSTLDTVLWSVWLGVLWLYYLISLATEKQIDIFENYREQRED